MKHYSKKQFIDWLRSHVKKSIIDDVGGVLPIFYKSGAGFFAVPRMLFPEIDGLGAYITGNSKSTSRNLVAYFRDVMSRIDQRYGEYAVFITYIFRHGLLHQHAPKKFKYGKKEFGWKFSINSGNSPESVQRKYHLVWSKGVLSIDMNLFYKDVVDSIEILITMIENKEVPFDSIRSSFRGQYDFLQKKDVIKYGGKLILKDDFSFLKK